MSEYAVEVNNVSKTFKMYHEKRNSVYESIIGRFSNRRFYDDLLVLKNISFQVKKGEMFGIIGKNGSGKTTLLRIISGIYKPDSGKATVNGRVLPLLGLGLGFHPEVSARSNVIQYGIILGLTKKEITERVDDVIKFAELEKFADTQLKNFSAGMSLRLAFSTAAQVDPDILLVDEVMHVGDLAFKKKSYEVMMTFKKTKSIVFVSHDMKTVQEHCDRAMFLNNGIIETIGKPEEVIEAYTKSSFPNKN